jgi:branched-chain amino acid transport system substrate-binding protein
MLRTPTTRACPRGALGYAGALACAALLAACSGSGPGLPAGPVTGALSPPAAAAPDGTQRAVKVAMLVPLSSQGHSGLIGKSLKEAAELALFERDSPNLQLIIKDDKGTPEGAKAAADEALKAGASLILGPLFAKSVTAVAPAARQAGVPVVAFSNDRQVAGNGVYLLGLQPAPEVARVVGHAARQGKRRFAALVPEDAFGKIVETSFREEVRRAGGTIVALETYPPSANAMLEPLRKISLVIRVAEDQGEPVDVLFIPGAQENLESLARLLPQAEIDTGKVKLIGTGGMDYPNVGRDAQLIGAWYPGPDPRGWSDFAQRYAKTYKQAPPRIATLAYDAVSLAIALQGGPEGQRYTPATLTRASGFSGVDGAFRLRADGTAERALAILEVQKFNSNIVDAAPSLAPPTAPAAAAGPGFPRSLFNFNFN